MRGWSRQRCVPISSRRGSTTATSSSTGSPTRRHAHGCTTTWSISAGAPPPARASVTRSWIPSATRGRVRPSPRTSGLEGLHPAHGDPVFGAFARDPAAARRRRRAPRPRRRLLPLAVHLQEPGGDRPAVAPGLAVLPVRAGPPGRHLARGDRRDTDERAAVGAARARTANRCTSTCRTSDPKRTSGTRRSSTWTSPAPSRC